MRIFCHLKTYLIELCLSFVGVVPVLGKDLIAKVLALFLPGIYFIMGHKVVMCFKKNYLNEYAKSYM